VEVVNEPTVQPRLLKDAMFNLEHIFGNSKDRHRIFSGYKIEPIENAYSVIMSQLQQEFKFFIHYFLTRNLDDYLEENVCEDAGLPPSAEELEAKELLLTSLCTRGKMSMEQLIFLFVVILGTYNREKIIKYKNDLEKARQFMVFELAKKF